MFRPQTKLNLSWSGNYWVCCLARNLIYLASEGKIPYTHVDVGNPIAFSWVNNNLYRISEFRIFELCQLWDIDLSDIVVLSVCITGANTKRIFSNVPNKSSSCNSVFFHQTKHSVRAYSVYSVDTVLRRQNNSHLTSLIKWYRNVKW